MTKTMRKPTHQSIAVVNRIRPRHMVAVQLKIFTPVGIAMSMLPREKKRSAGTPRPAANMWCAQTPKLSRAIATVEVATKA